jgi:hypothetical protein
MKGRQTRVYQAMQHTGIPECQPHRQSWRNTFQGGTSDSFSDCLQLLHPWRTWVYEARVHNRDPAPARLVAADPVQGAVLTEHGGGKAPRVAGSVPVNDEPVGASTILV